MNIKLKPVTSINTSDVLFDTKLKQLCVYPIGIDKSTFDVEYIKKHCLCLTITPKN